MVPQSFELATGAGRVWVHGNATKHLAEYATSMLAKGVSSELVKVATQAQLSRVRGGGLARVALRAPWLVARPRCGVSAEHDRATVRSCGTLPTTPASTRQSARRGIAGFRRHIATSVIVSRSATMHRSGLSPEATATASWDTAPRRRIVQVPWR